MFIIFGTKTVKTPAKNGLRLRRHCGRCQLLSDLEEYTCRPYFTLFFIPVVPVGKGESLLICSRCQAVFYPQPEDYLAAGNQTADYRAERTTNSSAQPEKIIVPCAFCQGRLRLPVRVGKTLAVTCPHC